MRKKIGGIETVFFLCVAGFFLLASITVKLLGPHLSLHKERATYGIEHLSAAFFSVFLLTLLIAFLHVFLPQSEHKREWPTSYFVVAIVAAFSIFWLPVFFSGGFVEDDWMLLAAASTRKIISLHPTYIWHTLDSVDGNFRPLGTVIYIGAMLHIFGVHPLPFLLGNVLVNFLACVVAFFIVRELGYSKFAAIAAAILYLSRDVTYIENAWVSALGDGISILFCALTVLSVLRATKRLGSAAVAYHALAWVFFDIAMLGKQSAFAAPAIVAALLFLRPGDAQPLPLARRARSALLALAVYGAAAATIYLHAKAMLRSNPPYELSLSFEGLHRVFGYVTWAILAIDPLSPGRLPVLIPGILGAIIVAAGAILVWRVPRLLGDKPRDVVFMLVAALASVALLVPLGSRVAPYYGAMFAFWISLALAVGLTRFGQPLANNPAGRIACFVFCLLVLVGYIDVRLKQTALIPSGGYIWGTLGMDQERYRYQQISSALAKSPESDTVVLADFPVYTAYYACMAMLADPSVKRVLVYDSSSKSFVSNNLQGRRPEDTFEALSDNAAYNWGTPMALSDVSRILTQGRTIWIGFHGGVVAVMPSELEMAP